MFQYTNEDLYVVLQLALRLRGIVFISERSRNHFESLYLDQGSPDVLLKLISEYSEKYAISTRMMMFRDKE